MGERVEREKARHGDQSGDLQETWTTVVAVDQSEVEDGSSVSLSKLPWSSLAFPPLVLFFPPSDHVSC